MRVLMVGVAPERVGGMWSVAEAYINSKQYNQAVSLDYLAVSTNGGIFKRLCFTAKGIGKAFFLMVFRPYDIIHVHMAERGSVFRKGLIIGIARICKRKIVIHMHAGPFMSFYGKQRPIVKNIIRKILLCSDKVLVLGEYWKKELKLLIPEDRIEVVYNGVNIPESNRYCRQARNIVFMSVFKREKGILDLLEAIKLIDNILAPDIIVQLCGYDEKGEIQERIKQLNLTKRIQYVGWVTEMAKEQIYRGAMLSVLPSYFEGLSISILEAMANGIPVITTNISTMPEVIGNNMYLVEPGDIRTLSEKILELCIYEDRRIKLSQSEYKRARGNFSMEQNIEKVLEIYENLLNMQKTY